MIVLPKKFKFIDLFAGIGGFHQAMAKMGGKCVFAAEIAPETAKTYKINYGIDALNDVSKIEPSDIPQHDVLCAGFPCQSFSKAGKQKGFDDIRGALFFEIVKILSYHVKEYQGPKFLLLENVRNLISHDEGNTWKRIREVLDEVGYNVIEKPLVVSPHYFGIPHLRERAVIVAVRKELYDGKIQLSIPRVEKNTCSINDFIVNEDTIEYKLSHFKITQYEENVLEMWDEFINNINRKIIGFPIWSDEFFQTYETDDLPKWKRDFILKNRKLYQENKDFIDSWYKKYNNLSWVKPTHRKFEWQVNGKIDSLFDGIIQFRPSGVRVKRPTEFPTLVAMVHKPIIGKYRRYITPREAANLQSISKDFKIDPNERLAYKQFGNAVNVEVMYITFRKFIRELENKINE